MRVIHIASYRIPKDSETMLRFFNVLPFIVVHISMGEVVEVSVGWLWWLVAFRKS